MFGALFNANIFGNIALIASEIQQKQTLLSEIINISNTAMKSINLNQNLTIKIISHIRSNIEIV